MFKYISLEGGEGVGKTTAINILKRKLEDMNHEVLVIREPGADVFGNKIRQIITETPDLDQVTQATLFIAAMKETYSTIIKPANDKDIIVISDRGPVSSLVYQAQAFGLGIPFIKGMFTMLNIPMPQMTYWLKLEPEVGLKRIADNNRDTNFFDKLDMSFHQKVYDGYQHIIDNNIVPMVEIDALKTPEEIAEDILIDM